jgi:hypothetical protein
MTNQSYINAWKDYRRRVLHFFGVFFGGFILAVLVTFLLLSLNVTDQASRVAPAIWLVFFVIASLRLQLFECPRCHEKFFQTFWYYNPFATKCVHCSLPKGQE